MGLRERDFDFAYWSIDGEHYPGAAKSLVTMFLASPGRELRSVDRRLSDCAPCMEAERRTVFDGARSYICIRALFCSTPESRRCARRDLMHLPWWLADMSNPRGAPKASYLFWGRGS